ncbi:MAG TPA: O-antigen ligase family protein, partial [Pyrinomonadaceae bacterium]|nr:O-antigen ligase family protein [Pyrinomonadaceae bacterium]
MTTSIYNARAAAAATPTGTPTHAEPAAASPALVAGARTLASRFIMLALCLAVMFSTLAFGTVHAWSLMFFVAGAGVVVVLWAADAWRTGSLRVSRNALQWPLAGLCLLGLVQLLPFGPTGGASDLGVAPVNALSLDPYATRFVVVQLAALLVYFAAALVFIDSPSRLRLVVRTVTIFGFLLAVFGLLQHFVSPDQIYWLRQPSQGHPFGPFINSHHFAAYMELTLALPLGLLFAGAIERERRFLYLFAVVLMAGALVLTNSRGGVLSLAVEVLFLFVLGGAVRRRGGEAGTGRVRGALVRAGAGLLLVLVLLGCALALGGEQSLSRLVGTVNADDPTSGRAQFWRGAVGVIKEHPIGGAGLGAFGVAYTRHDPLNGALRLEQAHNDYLQILADAGLVGGVLALVFVAALARMGLQRLSSADKFRRGTAAGALAGCAAVLVHSFFDFPLHIIS